MRTPLRLSTIAGAAIAAALVTPSSAPAQRLDADAVAQLGRAYAGEAIVRFEPGTTPAERLAARSASGVAFERALGLPQAQVVTTDGAVSTALALLERQPDVAYAQPNYRYRALAVPAPNDSFFGDLWGLQDPAVPNPGVDALAAWEVTRGEGQVIAVVDTGVALDHPDLAGNLWIGPGGVHGHDFVDGDGDPDDYNFHGTHVAGTAAAIADNALGVAGVAPRAQIMAVRVLDGDGSGSSADIAEGIDYASENGADVINLSLGGPADASDQLMSDAVTRADQRDVVVVAAAGNANNDNDATPTTPCTLPQPNLICVAAVNQAGGRAGFSNYGATTVDVGAPGTAILSAKTDYDQILADDFESGLGAWSTFTALGSTAWATTTARASSGSSSVTDSPGGNYVDDADSELFTTGPLDLTTERGCRLHLDLLYDIEDPDTDGSLFDFLFAGAVTDDPDVFDGLPFAGESSGYDSGVFGAEEASISDLGGRADVRPFLGLFADESVRRDGAYADDVEVLCRRATYLDSKAVGGNYVAFQGTSMAAPHVAGVATLAGAADPGAPDTQIVAAIVASGTPLAALSGITASGRTVDADAAIAAVLGVPNPAPPTQPPPSGQPAPAGTPGAIAPRLGPPWIDLGAAPRKLRVAPDGRFRYAFKALPGAAGRVTFTTVKRIELARRTRLALGRRAFVVGGSGKVAVVVELSRRDRRILRRQRKLATKVTVAIRSSAGDGARGMKRLTLLAPRR